MSNDTTNKSLFARILGAPFRRLPAPLQAVHDTREHKRFSGRCRVERGRGWIAALLASAARLPHTNDDVSVTIAIDRATQGETWTRNFGGHIMRSTMWEKSGSLEEKVGLTTLTFDLLVADEGIVWRLRRARLMFLPVPLALFVGTSATERMIDGRYSFDVRAGIVGVGLLIHYQGWLAEHG
jgi:hypothetical protein